jgi:CheY-like chemotaxis protein
MKILSAKVVDGRLDIPEGILEEGSKVTVLVQEPAEALELSEDQNQELSAAIAEANRGEGVDGWQFLRELRSN